MKCVILAVDQAARSGWAIWTPFGLEDSGVAVDVDGRWAAVKLALVVAERLELPLVPVFEAHTKHRGFSIKTALALHRMLGRWLELLDFNGVRRYVMVPIAQWRAFHGFGKGAEKAQLVEAAREIIPDVTDDNQAEAVLIGAWALTAKEVAAAIPRPRGRKRRPSDQGQ